MNLMAFLIFFGGFSLLLAGAHFLVEGGSTLGNKLRIPDIVIGLTIVSFGTSAPELVVSVMASAGGITDLAVSNVIGSNIFNTFIIIGVAALIYPVRVSWNTLFKEFPGSMFASLMLLVFGVFVTFTGETKSLGMVDGVIFLIFFLLFLVYNYQLSRQYSHEVELPSKTYSYRLSIIMILAGLAMLYTGGRMVVDGAVKIAAGFGLSERIIGLTIVAVATSLPELVTSSVAAFKRNSDIAIGNALGSNIFNIFFVLGVSAIVTPLPSEKMGLDIWVAILSNLLIVMFVLIISPQQKIINRLQGGILIFLYLLYVLYTVQ